MKPRAVVLFSGGLDSTLALAWAIDQGYAVTVLEFDYEGRPEGERRAAHTILRRFGSPPHVQLKLGATLRPPGATEGYLASRNLLLHSAAQSIAETLTAEVVIAGHLREDGEQFQDAKPDYLDSIVKLARLGRAEKNYIPLKLPLGTMKKAERRELAQRLKAPIDLAWSCWEDGPNPCGRCEKCRERARFLG